MKPDELIISLRQLLLARPEVAFAYLHGSFLTSYQNPGEGLIYHDVDVALYLSMLVSDPFDYETVLSVELTRGLGELIDVRVLNHAPLGFQHQVLQGELLFTRDEQRLTDFIEQVSWDYLQFAHRAQEYLQAVIT